MIVYHGSVIKVDMPDVQHSFQNLDFGKGFYVTKEGYGCPDADKPNPAKAYANRE